jgi:pimeloyl-ACP methyl ester carboxylesterase
MNEQTASAVHPAYSTAGFQRSVIRVDGVTCVVYAIGAGPTVVYFHGGGTFHGFEWARDWADRFRVVLPYHPNFGESGDADFATLGDYTAHNVRLLEALGLARFHLVGASMGGALAVEYAACRPACVERLVLVSPAGLSAPGVPPPDFSAVAPQDLPALFVHDPKFIEPFWPRAPGPEFRALRAREDAAALRTRQGAATGEARMRALVRGLRAPTLLLWGDDDRILPVALLREWSREQPAATVAIIPQGGHLLLDESLVARVLARDFLLGLPIPAAS